MRGFALTSPPGIRRSSQAAAASNLRRIVQGMRAALARRLRRVKQMKPTRTIAAPNSAMASPRV
jgi:hypothetical protein